MNFKIEKKMMNEIIGNLTKVLSVTMMLPVLRGIKIDVEENGISFTASDGTVSIHESINEHIEIFEFGSCVVEGKLLSDIVKKLDGNIIWIRKENNQLKIKSEKAELRLMVFADDAYPNINFDFPDAKFKVSRSRLINSVEKTVFSASDQQTRPILGGLNFSIVGDECIITGTDSYRLSQIRLPVVCPEEICITIPKKMLTLIASFIIADEELFLYFGKNKALISTENIVIQSALLDGKYPDSQQLIPTSFNSSIYISKDILLRALDRTSFNKQDGVITIGFELLNDEIILTSESKEIGSTIESIDVVSTTGDKNVKFFCNQQYILEAVKAIDEKICILHFISDSRPFLFTGEKNNEHIQLLLPVRHF